MNTECKELIVSVGNQQITGKDIFVREMNVNIPHDMKDIVQCRDGRIFQIDKAPLPVEVTLTFLIPYDKFSMDFFEETYKPKIRNKKVEDCTVKELLFAVRKKINTVEDKK